VVAYVHGLLKRRGEENGAASHGIREKAIIERS
jgi:hypothetical protein